MKNMKKWLSLLLTCVLLIGTFVIVPISANEVTTDATVEIVANNVLFGDAYYLMYAVDAQNLADGETVQVVICDANGEEVYAVAEQNGTINYNGVDCLKFVSTKGIPAQNIAVTAYAQAQVLKDGAVVATSEIQAYSIMEFIYETQLKGVADTDDITLFNALVDYATVAQSILAPDASVKIGDVSYSYVSVVNGTIDGTNTELMVNTSAGTVEGLLANLTATIEVPEGMNLAWNVTVDSMTEDELAYTINDEAAKALAIEACTAITLTATAVEGEVSGKQPETRSFDISTLFTKANTNSYTSYEKDGWSVTGAQVNKYSYTNDQYVPIINGNTSKKGTLTSATLTDGISKLSFTVALPMSEGSKGVSLKVEIKQNGETVADIILSNTTVEGNGENTATLTWENINVKGDFVIVITNNSPSNSTSNKDRTAIWNIEWLTNP